jgi:hypothetical protein
MPGRVAFAVLLLVGLAVPAAHAATSAQILTPLYTSVMGNEQRVYSARFFNGLNQPAVGETVRFSNDVCGRFQNGQFFVDVVTDTTGVASATFTAFNQGIGCWINAAAAGVSVRFNVFTYSPGQAYIDGSITPDEIRPGQPFTLTAGAYQGAYPIYEGEVSARVVPGTIDASVSPGDGNMGQSSHGVDFEVTPQDRIGDFDVEVSFRAITKRFSFPAPPSPLQDMWWAGAPENGWGMSVVQHRDLLFSVVYAYDDAGKPVWYVMPAGKWNEAKTAFTGALYLPTGTPYSAYDASKLVVNAPVGSATLTFNGASRAVFEYTIAGISGRKTLARQPFGPAESGAPLKGLGDMWWGGAQQNGWGIAVLQQYKSLFAVWFTYDAQGKPTWFVMPAGHWDTMDSYAGRLFRATGSAWLGVQYDPTKLEAIDVGSFRFRFSGDTATFDYTIDGAPGTLPLMRQGF